MTIAVPFFGSDLRFLKLLTCWFELHAASGTKIPAVVITDEAPPVGFPSLRVDTQAFADVMRGHPWDRKGAIVAAASQHLGAFLACDIDAFIQSDPEPLMVRLPHVELATRQDGWQRCIDIGGTRVDQRQAGVMWFGDHPKRLRVSAYYKTAFLACSPEFEADEWREQIAWSLVAAWTGLHELPKSLNCSHHDPGAGQAAIIHEHGQTKWRRIA
jgi:hypothetical protein